MSSGQMPRAALVLPFHPMIPDEISSSRDRMIRTYLTSDSLATRTQLF
jgi:hypothetical protein